MECDARIAKISEGQLREILEEVRKLRKKRKKVSHYDNRDRRTRSRRIRRGGSAICQVGSDYNLSIGGSLTNRWLVTLGIGTLLFGLSLFVLRVPRTIMIFFALGIPVVFLWLYVDAKLRRRSKQIHDFNKMQQQACACNFCKHLSGSHLYRE